jgi:hypothetical protein
MEGIALRFDTSHTPQRWARQPAVTHRQASNSAGSGCSSQGRADANRGTGSGLIRCRFEALMSCALARGRGLRWGEVLGVVHEDEDLLYAGQFE